MAQIRPAQPDDADALGAVHVAAWQAAYRGLMPEDYLDGLCAQDRARGWAQALSRPPRPRAARLVAQDDAGQVTGFIVVGPTGRADAGEDVGEVHALNVDPQVWGQGVGRALLEAGTDHLGDAGFTQAVLWVLPGNARARRFYEAAGWAPDGAGQQTEVMGVKLFEIGYQRTL